MAEQHLSRSRSMNRRAFFRFSAAAGAGALVTSRAHAAPAIKPERTLSFFNTHTGERLEAAYCCGGIYQEDVLGRINHILRDFRHNEVKPIDLKLLDLLHELAGTLGTDAPFHIISGYRSPVTNAMLRQRGGTHTGVATTSLHMVGKAIDIRIPGVGLQNLRSAAQSLKLGGVGYYPSSNFVHVDTGRVRTW